MRAALPDQLRDRMDALDRQRLRAELRIMRAQCAHAGWAATVETTASALAGAGRTDEVSVAVARIWSGAVDWGEDADLGAYDRAHGWRSSAM